MSRRAKKPQINLRKRPVQQRSRETFDAIVTACAWLLSRRGFAATTTNHIAARAGVNISSLYEYFPGKDAVVAQVAERLVERVLCGLEAGLPRVRAAEDGQAMELWIELIYQTVKRERALVAVFREQVPYTEVLPSMQALGPRLLAFSRSLWADAGSFVHPGFTQASLHLVINLVTSTILQLVLDPPKDVEERALLAELSSRVDAWVRGPRGLARAEG